MAGNRKTQPTFKADCHGHLLPYGHFGHLSVRGKTCHEQKSQQKNNDKTKTKAMAMAFPTATLDIRPGPGEISGS